jgi:hypothetical protein
MTDGTFITVTKRWDPMNILRMDFQRNLLNRNLQNLISPISCFGEEGGREEKEREKHEWVVAIL